MWDRFNAVDFFGHSLQLAALEVLCFFPFLMVVTAAAGRAATELVVGWLGLNHAARRVVDR